jgi:hypothetical protein
MEINIGALKSKNFELIGNEKYYNEIIIAIWNFYFQIAMMI